MSDAETRQRLGEWYQLWRDYPEQYAEGEELELKYGHTFRSAGRDSWPASLRELRQLFQNGRIPRGIKTEGDLLACRVCSL